MHIIFRTHSSNPEYTGDCDNAVVELTPTLSQEIRRRIELARHAGQRDNDLYELYFWGSTAEFYDQDLIEACEEAVAAAAADSDHAVRDWMTDLDEHGYALLPAGVDLGKHEAQRTECDQLIIRCSPSSRNAEFEVAWTTSPKHSDIYVTTGDLPLEALESFYHNDKARMSSEAVVLAVGSTETAGPVAPVEQLHDIRLPCYGITIRLDRHNTSDASAFGTITSDLKSYGQTAAETLCNAAIDGLESLILAHACAGMDVASPGYVEGIETAVDAITNQLA